MSAFSTVVKEIREQHDYSQEQLARKLNVSRSAVSMWERGKREPDYATLLMISNIFKVNIGYLLQHSDVEWDANQERLMEYFVKLNSLGKETAIQRLEELSEMDKYKK